MLALRLCACWSPSAYKYKYRRCRDAAGRRGPAGARAVVAGTSVAVDRAG